MTTLPFQGLNTKLKIFHNSCNSPATPGKDTGDTFSNCFYDFLHIPSNLFSAAMFLVVKKIVS